MHVDVTSVVLLGLGGFWVVGALVFGGQMSAGRFGPVKALHQDLSPEASQAVWWGKNVALGLIGALWLAAGMLHASGAPGAPKWGLAAAVAIAVEQLCMPLVSPRHWKSYTGVLVGVGLALLVAR